MKITSKSPNQHLVMVQEKLKLTGGKKRKKEKKRKKKEDTFVNIYIPKCLLYFSIFQRKNHQPISVADLG